jgi:LPXTG-site transpeptidase (sortase) family protein
MHLRRGVLVAGLALVFAAGAGFTVWRAATLGQSAQAAREHLGAARAALGEAVAMTSGDTAVPRQIGKTPLTSACTEAAAAETSLRDVNGQLQPVMPLVGALESLPGIGNSARSQAVTLQAGTDIASAGAALCDGLSPLTEFLAGAGPEGGRQPAGQVLQKLVAARPKLREAEQRLDRLQTSLGALPEADLEASNRAAVLALRTRLPQVVKTMRDADALLGLLGAGAPRRYLLVSQNPDELRATGGFIGSAGVVEARDGHIRLVEYGTSRRYDTPPEFRAIPPAEFAEYLGQNAWHLAGANWWASFPDVARQLAYFYSLSHPTEAIDGVIALDQYGLARLLEALGPVDVPEFGERVEASQVEAKLDHYVHAGDATDESSRKQFTAALSVAVLEAVLAAPQATLPDLVKATRAALDEQHLLVWVTDADAAQVFATRRWNGAILPTSGDALLMVDTDVVASKQSQAITRDATYTVSLTSGERPRATLAIAYSNLSRPEQRPDVNFVPTYRTFLRVFVPRGARLLDSSGFDRQVSTSEECSRQVFAGQVSIPQGSSTRVTLAYDLPAGIVGAAGYDLLVQQQPGTEPGHLTVSVITPTQTTARAEVDNLPGRHALLRLDSADTAELREAPLPGAPVGGCGTVPIQARPLAPPDRLEVPSAGIDAAVVDLGVGEDGQMEAPPTPDVVGWYRMSSRPGQPGNSVMSGHVDWGHATAVFWGLRNLRKGDEILVHGADGAVHTYAVAWNESYPAESAPTDRIIEPSKDSELTLITCDGVFDQRSEQYLERRVVRAQLID